MNKTITKLLRQKNLYSALLVGVAFATVGCSETRIPEPSQTQVIEHEGMPSNREILGWIQDLVSMGPRRTGSEAGLKAASYVAHKFEKFGLEDVIIETGHAPQWEADDWSLSVDGTDIPTFYIRHSFHPGKSGEFSTGPNGLNAEVIYVGDRTDLKGIDVKGKVVVANVELGKINTTGARILAESVYDPDNDIFDTPKLDPYTPNVFPYNYASAMKGGAVGFVGILTNYIDSNRFYNEDLSFAIEGSAHMSIPGLWVTNTEGELIKTLLNNKQNNLATMHFDGRVKDTKYHTVIGYLSGASDQTILVQSHHDSGFVGAVEDGSGTAEVLALAKYYGSRSASERERRMMFVTMDTHFTAYESHDDFVKKYIEGEEHNKNIVVDVAVEHVGLEMMVKDGKGHMTGKVEPRIFITSELLLELNSELVVKRDYRRTVVLPATMFEPTIPTDASPYYDAGIPVISMITAPTYLYDISDTLDKVAVEELQPTALLFADIIDRLDEAPREFFQQ